MLPLCWVRLGCERRGRSRCLLAHTRARPGRHRESRMRACRRALPHGDRVTRVRAAAGDPIPGTGTLATRRTPAARARAAPAQGAAADSGRSPAAPARAVRPVRRRAPATWRIRAAGIDDPAFRDYVRSRSRALLRTAYLLTGNLADAEDLVQSALAKTYLAWDRIEDRGALDGYVRRAMVNTHISWWRRRRLEEFPTDEIPDQAVVDHSGEQRPAGVPAPRHRPAAAADAGRGDAPLLRGHDGGQRSPRCSASASAPSRARSRVPWPSCASTPSSSRY